MTATELCIPLSDKQKQDFEKACELDAVEPEAKARGLITNYAAERLSAADAEAAGRKASEKASEQISGKTSEQTASAGTSDDAAPQTKRPTVLRVAEMFSGPGGIGVALNRTHTDKHVFEHVWSTDYDADTCDTYRTNVLKDSPNAAMICEDVRKLDIDALPEADGFLYGFPCNDFSTVGESKGLEGNFGGLYSYGVKYINRVNPLFFLAENVSGLSSANEGRAFKKILSALNHAGDYGYTITANLYKFEDYGLPQARHRYILIGIRGDLAKTFAVLPELKLKRLEVINWKRWAALRLKPLQISTPKVRKGNA